MIRLLGIPVGLAALLAAIPGFSQTSTTSPEVARPGVNGVTVPTCISCPVPPLHQGSAESQIRGRRYLGAEVTAEGRVINISVIKGPGLGLEERAIEYVRKWRFKPAHDADGNPVLVWLPIQVAFRLK